MESKRISATVEFLSNRLSRNLLCERTAGSPRFSAIELTAPQSSFASVAHGHGAENAGETKRKFRPAKCTQELLMKNLVSRFVKDESGATAIEYGLIAASIAIAIITAVKGVGTALNSTFTSISSSLK